VVGAMVRAGVKPTYRVRLYAWLLLRAAIRYRFEGRARRRPEAARRPATPGRCAPRGARVRLTGARSRRALPRASGLRQAGRGRHGAQGVPHHGRGKNVARPRLVSSPLVVEGVRVMGVADYLAWSLLAALCAAGSVQLFVAAERHEALAQAWLAAMAFGLWSTLTTVCFWRAA
jgi:hypothetical protein